MRFALALALAALALALAALAGVQATAAAAQGEPAYYCDPLHVYYPAVARCPVPWRAVSPTQPSPASQGPIALLPQAPRPSFPMLGDGLDNWCKTVALPSSVAICSDPELRTLALERQRAYDGARARLSPEQQKALLADQNGWVRSYARACGLGDDRPSLPLAPTIKDCMAEAGRARIAYLKAYGTAAIGPVNAGAAAAESLPAARPDSGPPCRCRDPKTNFVYERPQPCATATGDPLLDAVHNELVKTASDLCAQRSLTRATELCFSGPMKPEEVSKDCPQDLASSMSKACPDGPEKLVEKWEASRLASTINFRDFALDKEEMARPDEYGVGKLVIIRGVYIRPTDSMDYLLAPGELNPMAYGRSLNSDVAIPLLLDDAKFGGTDRKSRAALMTCREKYPPEAFTGCTVMLSGFVQKCMITMQLTGASHEAVCIKVSDVVVNPRN